MSRVGDIEIIEDKNKAIDTLLECYPALKMPRESAELFLADWDCFAFAKGGEVIGAGILRKGEAHFGIKKQYRGKWDCLKHIKLLTKYFCITHTTLNQPKTIKLYQRLGWKQIGESSQGVIYAPN